MVRASVESLLGTVVLTALLPVAIFSAFRQRLPPARIRRPHKSGSARASANATSHAIGEFDFERAMEAYERLIDELIGETSR
jgi:hypothetical protein